MTECCANFICSLALETSYESCSWICKVFEIRIRGDTVIRLLLKRYPFIEGIPVGEKIGIDEFVYKKCHTYGTVIVDGKIYVPITFLKRIRLYSQTR